MEKIIDFIGNNYVWFLTISIILIFALIGYIVDTKKSKNDLFSKAENELDEQAIENLKVPEGKSLAETVNTSKSLSSEELSEELMADSGGTNKSNSLEEGNESP